MELTLAELEEMIECAKSAGADEDTPVHIAYNYGDHWATTVSPKAYNAELLNVERSEYHSMDKLTEDDGDSQTDNSRLVFVIQ